MYLRVWHGSVWVWYAGNVWIGEHGMTVYGFGTPVGMCGCVYRGKEI